MSRARLIKNAFNHIAIITDLLTPGVTWYPSFSDRVFNLWIIFSHPERQLTPEIAFVTAAMVYILVLVAMMSFLAALDREFHFGRALVRVGYSPVQLYYDVRNILLLEESKHTSFIPGFVMLFWLMQHFGFLLAVIGFIIDLMRRS